MFYFKNEVPMCPESHTGWVWIFFSACIVLTTEKWRKEKRRWGRVNICDKLKSSALLNSLVFFPHYSEFTMLATYSTLFSHPLQSISIDCTYRFKHFCSPCTARFCSAAGVSTTALRHVSVGSMFWATYIPLQQFWGLEDLSWFTWWDKCPCS